VKRSANCYLPENLSSPLILSEVRITHSLVFWVVLCRLLLVVLSFFFLPLYRLSSCRYIVCLRFVVSSVFLPSYRLSSCRCIVCLLAVVLSVFLPLYRLSSCRCIVCLLAVVSSVFLSLYCLSSCRCTVCPSLIYDFWLPLWYFQTFLERFSLPFQINTTAGHLGRFDAV
jgi:hypothetical protein